MDVGWRPRPASSILSHPEERPRACISHAWHALESNLVSMAKTLQVRGVPEDVHAALRARAATAGLSLSDYLLRTLTEVAERPPIAETLRAAAERSGGASRADVADVLAGLRGR